MTDEDLRDIRHVIDDYVSATSTPRGHVIIDTPMSDNFTDMSAPRREIVKHGPLGHRRRLCQHLAEQTSNTDMSVPREIVKHDLDTDIAQK